MSEIRLVLEAPDELEDPDNSTGLTNEGFDELMDTLLNLGYSFVEGPESI